MRRTVLIIKIDNEITGRLLYAGVALGAVMVVIFFRCLYLKYTK